jgi:DNA-binding CsgD family transcriptional regulator
VGTPRQALEAWARRTLRRPYTYEGDVRALLRSRLPMPVRSHERHLPLKDLVARYPEQAAACWWELLRGLHLSLADLLAYPDENPVLALVPSASDAAVKDAIRRLIIWPVFQNQEGRRRKIRAALGADDDDVQQDLLDRIVIKTQRDALPYLAGHHELRQLRAVAMHHIMDLSRKAARRVRWQSLRHDDQLQAGGAAMDDVLAIIDLSHLLAGLSPQERQWVRLRWLGYQNADIGKRLRVSAPRITAIKRNVQTKLARAL